MNILVCDDDKYFADNLSQKLHALATNWGRQVRIECITDCKFVTDEKLACVDIAFLDIDLGDTNGIDLARRIRIIRKDTILIFVTNYIEYSLEGYEVQAFRYLLKSEVQLKLMRCFSQTLNAFDKTREHIRLLCEGEEYEILLQSLVYVETEQRHLLLHLHNTSRAELRTNITMNKISQFLEDRGFLRVHQSYLVNMCYIKKLQSTGVWLSNSDNLPISARNYKVIRHQYLTWRGKNNGILA